MDNGDGATVWNGIVSIQGRARAFYESKLGIQKYLSYLIRGRMWNYLFRLYYI